MCRRSSCSLVRRRASLLFSCHANKSDKCAKIYEVQRRSSGTKGTRVPLADSAGMEATTVRGGEDWSGFGGSGYGHAAVSCMQIMKMWVFGGTRAEFFVFQLFTQPVGNQGEFAAIARLPWPTCLSRFFWGRSLSIFFSLAKEFIIEAFFFSLLCFEYRKPFFIIKGKSKTISISLIHLAGCFCFPPNTHRLGGLKSWITSYTPYLPQQMCILDSSMIWLLRFGTLILTTTVQ